MILEFAFQSTNERWEYKNVLLIIKTIYVLDLYIWNISTCIVLNY